MPYSLKRSLLIAALLLILIGIFFHRNIFGMRPSIPFDLLYELSPWKSEAAATSRPQNAELFDQAVQFYPWWTLIVDEIRRGRVPLWNPFSFCGSPLLANGQSGVFYPLKIVNLLFAPSVSSILLSCGRLFIAGTFMLAYLRQLGLRRDVSLFGAVVFAFSRNVIVWLGFPAADAAVILPALFWICERLLKNGGAENLAIGGILIGAQFLAGQPQISLVSGLALSIYFTCQVLAQRTLWSRKIKLFALYVGMWTLGASLAAIQIFPMMEYMKESAAWAFRSQFNLKAYPAYEVISFIIPDFFGTPYDGNYWGFANLVGTACYIGVGPLVLALMSLTIIRKEAYLQYFWIITIVCVGVVYKLPLFGKLSSLPLLNATDTNKYLVVIVFSLVVCSATALEQIVNGAVARAVLKALVVCTMLLGVTVAVCLQFREFLSSLRLQRYEATNFAIFALFLVASLLILLTHSFFRLGASTVCGLLTAMAYLDLFIFGQSYNAASPGDNIPTLPPAITRIQHDLKNYRVLGLQGTLPPNTSMLYQLADVRGYDALTPKRYFNFLSKVLPDYADFTQTLDLNEAGETMQITSSTLFKQEIRRMLSSSRGEELRDILKRAYYWNTDLDRLAATGTLNAFSVRYILASKDRPPHTSGGLRPLVGDGASVMENPGALPRAYVLRDFTITDDSAALQIVANPEFDFHRRVVLSEVDDAEVIQKYFVVSEANNVGDPTEIIREDPSHVEIFAHTTGPRILVLTDLYFPGWRAYVDGKWTKIYAANYLFRAIALPQAGNHTIRFEYAPTSFVTGAVVSASAGLICVLAMLISVLQCRRSSILNGGNPPSASKIANK